MNAVPIQINSRFVDHVDVSKFGSPIEEEFYRVISKYLDPSVEFFNQYPAKAQGYNFAVDFVIVCGSQKIGIECDGKEYHDFRKDSWRDKAILEADLLDSIVRFRGTDINFRLSDALYAMAQWYPEIFSQRGKDNIEVLATETAKKTEINDQAARFSYNPHEYADRYQLEHDDDVDDKFGSGFGTLQMFRRRKGDF